MIPVVAMPFFFLLSLLLVRPVGIFHGDTVILLFCHGSAFFATRVTYSGQAIAGSLSSKSTSEKGWVGLPRQQGSTGSMARWQFYIVSLRGGVAKKGDTV